ncbi:hypothetical protein DFS33DRAFT_1383525 [Desarmillaria ectypa]|nr:hypothetical protein DFS33DRAFT_1383525 [Desarmillaria ectypa]
MFFNVVNAAAIIALVLTMSAHAAPSISDKVQNVENRVHNGRDVAPSNGPSADVTKSNDGGPSYASGKTYQARRANADDNVHLSEEVPGRSL